MTSHYKRHIYVKLENVKQYEEEQMVLIKIKTWEITQREKNSSNPNTVF